MREIARMNDKYRTVLYLRLLGEETVDEIARRVGLRTDSVRMRLFRGMRRIRKALKKQGIGLE